MGPCFPPPHLIEYGQFAHVRKLCTLLAFSFAAKLQWTLALCCPNVYWHCQSPTLRGWARDLLQPMKYRRKHLIAGRRLNHQFLPEQSGRYVLVEDEDAQLSLGAILALELQWILHEGKRNLCFNPLRQGVCFCVCVCFNCNKIWPMQQYWHSSIMWLKHRSFHHPC